MKDYGERKSEPLGFCISPKEGVLRCLVGGIASCSYLVLHALISCTACILHLINVYPALREAPGYASASSTSRVEPWRSNL
jgi:hypothetical protein